MIDKDRNDMMEALRRVRDQLQAAFPVNGEGELTSNPVYAAWERVSEALEILRFVDGEPRVQPGDSVAAPHASDTIATQAMQRDIDLPAILETIRKGEPTQGDATEQPRAEFDEDIVSVAQPVARTDAAGLPVLRLEEKRSLERSEEPLPGEEAAVTFVIREEQQASAARRSRASLLDRTQGAADRAISGETYFANAELAEEAEVVVVKPQSQLHYRAPARADKSSVRRFLRALRGG